MDDATTVWAADYEVDALAWAERQAALLQRLAHGQDAAAEIDWPHVIEEVADVGLSELRSVMSPLTRAIEHLLKIRARPGDPSLDHWANETLAFLTDAKQSWTPSMRQRIDMQRLYRDARRLAERGRYADDAPQSCPFAVVDLILADDDLPDLEDLRAKLDGSRRPPQP